MLSTISIKPAMDALVEKLNIKLNHWQPDIAEQVRHYVSGIIEMADQDRVDVLHSRAVEQEVLDLLDEP